MDGQRRKRLAARFARVWKRQVRADDRRLSRRFNLERLEWQSFRDKRRAIIAITIVAAVALIALWLRA